jgi:hypothetical protein
MPKRATALALVLSLAGAAGEATQPPPSGPSQSPALDPVAEALRRLSESVPPDGSPPPDDAARARLCDRWLEFTAQLLRRAENYGGMWEETWKGKDVASPGEYMGFAQMHLREFGSMGPEMKVAYEIARKIVAWKIPCPPPDAAEQPKTAAVTEEKDGRSAKPWLIGGGAAAAGLVAVAAGGGGSKSTPSTTPPTTQPPDVTSLHGTYTGRLVTTGITVSGCGRAATAPCNAALGGSANGTPATLSFGGDLPSTGVLRPGGALEGFSYEGPANGLGGLPAGVTIRWRQQGTVTNNVLRLDGTATVTSPGPCNGAVIATTVEATKN